MQKVVRRDKIRTVKKAGKLLQVAQLGHKVLRKKSLVVKDINNQGIQSLINDLIATVMDVDGVGMAAPQVYQSVRLFIVASHPNPRYPNAPYMRPTAIINPEILSFSKDKAKDWEGCLSIPGIRALVPRSKTVTAEYTTRDGKRVKKTYKDFIARIFQHEYDHLEGIVFVDRIESSRDIISEKEYQLLMKKKNKKK